MKRLALVLVIPVLLALAGTAKAAENVPSVTVLAELPGDVAVMQAADVDNPSAVSFTVSADHALVSSYELDILRPDSTVLQTLNLGKPTPDAAGTATAPINVQPVAFGNGYSVRLRALAGTATSASVNSDNKFNRRPGGPSKVEIK
jgi:hypothetical protein